MESDDWNYLEVARLAVAALTPIVVAILGSWIVRISTRLEQREKKASGLFLHTP